MTTRKQIEIDVCAVNKPLREKVKDMDIMELLRNCHPAYRVDYARVLYKDGIITEAQMKEFIIIKRT